MNWNPRYIAYAAAHGLSAADMHDTPAGRFPAFTAWLSRQWSECAAAETQGRAADMQSFERLVGMAEAHRRFNRWLAARYPAVEEVTP